MSAFHASDPTVRARLLSISAKYRNGSLHRSAIQLGVTVGLWAASYAIGLRLMQYSPWAGTLGALVTAVFVVRLFMIQHDCGHGSFFQSRRANDWLGFWLGVITMTPYRCWRRFHAQHHVNSGNLDRRGLGDIFTLTTVEYRQLSPRQQRLYQLYRHPLVLFVLGPPLLFILRQRTTYKVPHDWTAERRSVHLTNLVLVAGALLVLLLASQPLLVFAFHLLTMALAAIIGVWLFYVQHQFPQTYWRSGDEWEPWRASMEGASYYELPAVLRWLTANIGLHHIHHLDARIPNYRLYECFTKHEEFAHPPRLGLRESLGCIRLKLWDEERRSMVPISSQSSHMGA